MDIALRVQALKSSATLAISQRAAELRQQGRDVISLSAGEPDFPTPEDGIRAAREALDAGRTHYTATAGIVELREAIRDKFRADNGLEYDLDQITVSTGVKQGLYTALTALLNPGDEVLIPSPYWVTYPAAARLLGAEPRFLTTDAEHGFKVQPEAVEEALSPRSKVFILNSPSNPTGAVYDRGELRALGEVLARSNVWIITDEIYEKLVFDGAEHLSLLQACPELMDRTVVMNGVSKAYAMTGWRIGYSAGPRAAISAMNKVQGHMTSNPTSISQYAAVGALRGSTKPLQRMQEIFSGRRLRVVKALQEIDGIRLLPPRGAFYVFPEVSAFLDDEEAGSAELCRQILEQVEVAVVPGEAFGDGRCLRISYAASDAALDEAIRRLQGFFRSRP